VFQKSIYLREIIKGGQTIAGEHLLEQIPLLPITTLDLIQRLRFDIGMALAALLSFRAGDTQTSHACLACVVLRLLSLKHFQLATTKSISYQSKSLLNLCIMP
jgi:hypothetical protein